MNHRETNPHFYRPRPQHEDHQQPPIPIVPHQEHQGQPPPIQQEDQPYHPHYPLEPRRHADNQHLPISQAPPREKHGRAPRGGARKQHEDQPYLPHGAYGGQPPPREKRDRTPHGGAHTQHEDQPQPPPQEHRGQPPHGGSRKQHEEQPFLIPRAYGGWPPRKTRTQHEDQPHQPPQDHHGQPPRVNFQEQSPKPHGSLMLPPSERHHGHSKKRDRTPPREKRDRTPHGGVHTQHEDQPQPPPQEHRGQPPHGGSRKQHEDQPYLIPKAYGGWPPRKTHTQHEDQPHQPPQDHRGQPPQDHRGQPPRVNFQEQSPKPHGSSTLLPPERHHGHRKKPDHGSRPLNIEEESSQKSKACTWCGIVFCIIFSLVIIIGGLIVLIVYLVFRPQSPHFDVSSVTLNAAYLDLGYLLNADVTLLANFTNPNKRVHVDFSSVIIYLYYGSTLIASQYVEPFSAARNQSRFAAIHMVTSQVQLPSKESQRMVKQMESNGVLLEVSGVFRAKSKLGKILRYSYNLYGHCNIMVTRPPDGVMLKKKCRTKR